MHSAWTCRKDIVFNIIQEISSRRYFNFIGDTASVFLILYNYIPFWTLRNIQ